MTAKIVLTAATAAAALASAAPAVSHGSRAQQPVVSAEGARVRVVAPAGAKLLTASLAGSRRVAAQARMTVVRTSDGATLFTGSLATFHGLRVQPGTSVRVEVQKVAAGAHAAASARLRWS